MVISGVVDNEHHQAENECYVVEKTDFTATQFLSSWFATPIFCSSCYQHHHNHPPAITIRKGCPRITFAAPSFLPPLASWLLLPPSPPSSSHGGLPNLPRITCNTSTFATPQLGEFSPRRWPRTLWACCPGHDWAADGWQALCWEKPRGGWQGWGGP